MKKILNKVRWNIVEALKGEEKVPEKGFKITTWVGQYGQHDENLKVIDDLYKGLYRKRQIAYGGIFKQIARELRFDDVENGDLIVVDEETGEITNGTKLVAVWNWERKNYRA